MMRKIDAALTSQNLINFGNRWIPAIFIMVVIFLASNTPSQGLPDFGTIDTIIKKGAHMIGYGLLALSYSRAFHGKDKFSFVSILGLVFLYAISDEFHQSFISGRHASPIDVLIDLLGAILALLAFIKINVLKKLVYYKM